MRVSTGSRVFVVSVRFVVRISVRAARTCRPWVERAALVVVELVAAEAGETSTALTRYTRYAIVGGVTASAFALARAFAGPGVSELLSVIGVVSVGAVAVYIAVRLVHEAQHSSRAELPYQARALFVATTQRIADSHRGLAFTRTLEFLYEPRRVAQSLRDPALLAGFVQRSLRKLLLGRAVAAVPGLSVAREAMDVVTTGISHARFIHDFETSARQLCAARAA
jgi:hypothetical protein